MSSVGHAALAVAVQVAIFLIVLLSLLCMAAGSLRVAVHIFVGTLGRPFLILQCKLFYAPQDEHYTGYKWARIKCVGDGLRFKPIFDRHPAYVTTDEAVCMHGRAAPNRECECGFYALKCRRHLGWVVGTMHPDTPSPRRMATLEVDLSGSVREASLGYRAQKQRVLRVIIPAYCALKRKKHALAFGVRILDGQWVVPVCYECCPEARPLSWVADQLGTEVVWDNKRPVV